MSLNCMLKNGLNGTFYDIRVLAQFWKNRFFFLKRANLSGMDTGEKNIQTNKNRLKKNWPTKFNGWLPFKKQNIP